ncbi:ChaN family lipoprotein [Chachezhania sediminis]|uniref:ChaN family lipoprotein n=1 Tax=Chachezhania sediminis TaxID=2599291 RepID=UPI00131BD8B9|nr:ChaN family lipoprotein [Chachezhania sediminis]
MTDANIVIVGENHDNVHHHDRQAAVVAELKPRAVVWEMMSPTDAVLITPDLIGDKDALATALDWENSGWPGFDLYYPIIEAAPAAKHYGAEIAREDLMDIYRRGAAAVLPTALRFRLGDPLPPAEQEEREALQKAAHCDMLPDEQLPAMVEVQRARDAALADAALRALEATGGPVVVIAGNGHARSDWGVPAALELAQPGIKVFSLGQAEDGRIEGRFNAVLSSPGVERDDACEPLRKE